ncbi:MAG: hypothetical protein ACRDRU_14485 [Pseudonocardiaceae bacterium]
MSPAIEQLRRLRRFGFTGERLFNQDGHVELVQRRTRRRAGAAQPRSAGCGDGRG